MKSFHQAAQRRGAAGSRILRATTAPEIARQSCPYEPVGNKADPLFRGHIEVDQGF